MFDAAEIGHTLSKEDFEARLPALRVGLLNAQFDLRKADFPVILVVAGEDRLGCQEMINFLGEVFDSRFLETTAVGRPAQEEAEHPEFWTYWRALPPKGRIGVVLGGWMVRAMVDRLEKQIGRGEFARRLDYGRRFERMLVADGALVLKFWLHIPKRDLKKRLMGKGRRSWWRPVGVDDWRLYRNYEKAMRVIEEALEAVGGDDVPWNVIESTDPHYRNLTVANAILDQLRGRLSAPPAPPAGEPRTAPTDDPHTILDTVDLSARLEKAAYEKELIEQQKRLNRLSARAHRRGVSTVLVFEGWDAAGKGGAIRRLTAALDPTIYRVQPIAAPTEEERAHHYLWRFWRHLPRAGRITIFDRSWYGRVLVERVEGFAREDEWRRAYGEINDFEAQLAEHGVVVRKFWLHIDPDTQLARFKEREATAFKQYKITDEDYRNRERWHDYEAAVNEMIARTSTRHAPWHVIPAKDKFFGRIAVLKTVRAAWESSF